ncbi:Phenylalanine--tRNA ligase alpha subunit [Candidatus Anstonella stagnisolia]|nr:Phenylalanine--tRNA ligase alpha subunit [Candidatus Anstonella stagnisolia]
MLHQYEKLILAALAKSNNKLALPQLLAQTSLNADAATKASLWLCDKSLAKMDRTQKTTYSITDEGKEFSKRGFPEMRALLKADAGASMSDLSEDEKKFGLSRALKNGWLAIEGVPNSPNKRLSISPKGRLAMRDNLLSKALHTVLAGNEPSQSEIEILSTRGILAQKQEKTFTLSLTPAGEKTASSPEVANAGAEINQLTREMLLDGSWKGAQLREYDVSAPADSIFGGKRHMINRLQRRIRDIFLQMGFEEMQGSIMESSFWNFDALFQPQDHPARELADTFYLKGTAQLPEEKLVSKVKAAHEKGWKYDWLESEAQKQVLRTHTTALSARYLVQECPKGSPPRKFFAIGKVFRNEATDFKHLAEFYQVEGIVVDENANFSQLLGLLRKFYESLGFKKIRFRPSFFPYTEPSLEIEVYFEEKKQWFELGGAGIFRPEVSIPLCGRYPVLAWGLSLERPLMLLNNINDIRSFYKNNVGWLRGSKLR